MKEEIILKLLEKLLGSNSEEKQEVNKYSPNIFYIVRTYSAGVFAGYIESRCGREIVMLNAIRIWQWAGANSLSQLAMEGTKNNSECKFAMPVNRVELLEVIEILNTTLKAETQIKELATWKK